MTTHIYNVSIDKLKIKIVEIESIIQSADETEFIDGKKQFVLDMLSNVRNNLDSEDVDSAVPEMIGIIKQAYPIRLYFQL